MERLEELREEELSGVILQNSKAMNEIYRKPRMARERLHQYYVSSFSVPRASSCVGLCLTSSARSRNDGEFGHAGTFGRRRREVDGDRTRISNVDAKTPQNSPKDPITIVACGRLDA